MNKASRFTIVGIVRWIKSLMGNHLIGVKESMKRTFSTHAAVILTAITLAAAPVFATETTTTAAAKPAAETTAAAKPAAETTAAAKPAAKKTTVAAKKTTAKKAVAAIKVPVISVSKYGEKTAGSFTIAWTDASNGKDTYTLERAEADKKGTVSGEFAPVTSAKNADNTYSATDTVAAEKYYKYRLSASDGKTTVKGTVSKTASSVTAVAAPAATTAAAPAAKK
jgi:hypothetical protein